MAMQTPAQQCEEYERTWKQAVEHSRSILGEDDFEYVQGFHDVKQLLNEVRNLEEQYTNSPILRLLKNLRPHIHQLHFFATFLMASIGSQNISSACVFGTTCLLIQLASTNHDSLSKIATHLNEVGQRLRLFEIYKQSVELEPQDLDLFFDLLVELLLTCAAAIKFFRRHDTILGAAQWPVVDKKFLKTVEELSQRLEYLKQIAQARNLAQMQHRASASTIGEMSELSLIDSGSSHAVPAARLPYRQLPFVRNPDFYGRSAILQSIDDHLRRPSTTKSVRSIALWGTGGIGKSQLALEYANKQLQVGCPLIIWIPSETDSEISKALVDAAMQIQPPGFVEGSTPDKIRYAMWNWLQTTDVDWLLIFDNVENNELLFQNWPACGCGRVLVTCRSELLAGSPVANKIEIPVFTTEEGAELLLRLSGKTDCSQVEREAALEISNMLGGLPLGIDITARQALVKKKPMKDFLEYFKQNKIRMRAPPRYSPRNPYYSKTLINTWQHAFEGLSSGSSRLIGLICFLAPDGIPRDIFDVSGNSGTTWPFSTEEECEEAQEELLLNALIKIDETSGNISIHRLTQEAYFYAMSNEQKHEGFIMALRVLTNAFPKRLGKHMYTKWKICEPLIHHIFALSAKWKEMRHIDFNLAEPEWAVLMADAAWFCGESERLQAGEQLALQAAENWSNRESLEYALICESTASILHRRGRYIPSYEYFCKALEIRKSVANTPEKVLADNYSAVGVALFGQYRSEESIEYINVARKIAENMPEDVRDTSNYDRYLRNLARPKVELGRFEDAKQDLDEADRFQERVYGPGSHFHGETAITRGVIEERQGNLDEAANYFQLAYDLCHPGKPTHQSVAAARYHQALVCLERTSDIEQNQETALQYLQHALQICQYNEARRGDGGESARVMWQIAKVWQARGSPSKAAHYEAAALRTKLELEELGQHPVAPTDEKSWDCFSDSVYR